MNPSTHRVRRLSRLMAALRNDALSSDQAAELGQMLADADCRRQYIEWVWLWASLESAIASPCEAIAPQAVAGRGRALPLRSAWALAAMLLMATAAVAIYVFAATGDQHVRAHPHASHEPVATLIWADAALEAEHPLVTGERLRPQTIRTLGGETEIQTTTGANIVLHGACELTLQSPHSVLLGRGDAAFDCPPSARGFTVHLPDRSRIVDLGTAFRVEVDNADRATLRVTEGLVVWTPPGHGAEPVSVSAGQLARLSDGEIHIDRFAAGVIYEDRFAGDHGAPLNGASPDTRPGDQAWIASDWRADGTVQARASASSKSGNAWLPFRPETGRVYTLSLVVDPHSSKGGDTHWFATGFAGGSGTTAPFPTASINASAWLLHRVERDDATFESVSTFLGPTNLVGRHDHAGIAQSGPVEIKILLDTRPALWTAEWFYEGTSIRGPVAFASNPAIDFVGFGRQAGAGGAVQNFKLTVEAFDAHSEADTHSHPKENSP